jgi:hypothetical protein
MLNFNLLGKYLKIKNFDNLVFSSLLNYKNELF